MYSWSMVYSWGESDHLVHPMSPLNSDRTDSSGLVMFVAWTRLEVSNMDVFLSVGISKNFEKFTYFWPKRNVQVRVSSVHTGSQGKMKSPGSLLTYQFYQAQFRFLD